MADLVSMRSTPAERKQEAPTVVSDKGPEFPWGLRLDLNNESLEKLAMTMLPAVGTAMMLQARVEVVHRSESENEDGEMRRSVDLQITDMALSPEPTGEGIAEKLFPER